MEVKHMTSISDKSFQDVSFNLRKGEILGFGGLVGAQRTEVLEGVFGIRALKSGEVYVKGKKVTIKHPADAMKAGIGLITEDRRGNGIFGCLSIKDNVGVSTYNKYLKAGIVLDHKKIGEIVDLGVKLDLIDKAGAWYTYGDVRVQGRDSMKEYLREHPDVSDKIEAEIRANAHKLMSPQARKAAIASGRAVEVAADDFQG